MSDYMGLPSSIAGFRIIPVAYNSTTSHILYARKHVGSKRKNSTSLPEGRTLFLVNVPPDATEREMVLLFKNCGTVERVVFDWEVSEPDQDSTTSDEEEEEEAQPEQQQPRKRRKLDKGKKEKPPAVVPLPHRALRVLRKTGHSAHVVFLDESSLERALAPAEKPRPWPTSSEEPRGLAHYLALYDSLRPPLDVVRDHADTWMEMFDYEQAKKKQKSEYRKGEAIVDEDGFTLVTRGGAYGQTLGGGVGVASKRFQETGQVSKRKRKKKDPKEKEDFYAFQRREKKRNELLELQRKWEADKAKVEELKASKRFKPY
ncbi:hypothetical protein GLOTRDRAFT_69978 [Gloeophyllum trabeum ATCC 11539]|uniref:RRM domain-containing protein n=1 Tax=Gloeophyllum trabeum (strain ATCC 11539 / FP-39264 / Madison 617) TaxID=670483 RepID=S7QI80_GLOTA|nr:uncharacterized protein GLOTRDRAFT_69978 [Gloeophyllum trabeum ATCC 11539]EPQ58938.1 hypothetical protein GLOTRDRAFT_69978 [Gloeophyllum trabeum ATCC 11539]